MMYYFAVHDERLGRIVQSKMSASRLFQQPDGLAGEYSDLSIRNHTSILMLIVINTNVLSFYHYFYRWPVHVGGTIFPNSRNSLTQ